MISTGLAALPRAPLPPPTDDRSDDELMQRAASGDASAYENLVRRHQRRVRAYCGRWCGSGVVGDDLAQECFVELWQRRQSYVGQGRFKAYLFRIAANRCKNQQRSAQREWAWRETRAQEASEPESQRVLLRERRRRVQASIEKLPDAQRETVLLRFSADLDYAEIAALLDVPEATARSRVFAALLKLRRLLEKDEP
jgi:RNA polymerase sigma-70 factor (ECF subfamily)